MKIANSIKLYRSDFKVLTDGSNMFDRILEEADVKDTDEINTIRCNVQVITAEE